MVLLLEALFVPACCLIAAFFSLPYYGMYEFLKILVMLQAGIYMFFAYADKNYFWLLANTISFIAFFPLFKFRFGKQLWQYLDIYTALVFIASVIYIVVTDKSNKK